MNTVEETEPLLRVPRDDLTRNHTHPPVLHDPHKPSRIVDFDPDGDPENPQEWSRGYKHAITSILTWMAFNVTFCWGSVIPISRVIVQDLSPGAPGNKYAMVLLVTIWELGEAAGPLFIAPLSETFGRYAVLSTCNTLMAVMTLISALSPTTPVLIALRALSGLFVGTNVINPGIVGDIYQPERRGSPMSLVSYAPLVGGCVGPAIAGALAEVVSWRWVLACPALLIVAVGVMTLTCLRETYKPVILKRRAIRFRREEEQEGLLVPADSDDDIGKETKYDMRELLESIMRPFYVFGSSGVLMSIDLFGAIAFSNVYTMVTNLSMILDTSYGLSPKANGLCLFAFSGGATLSVLFCNIYLDRLYIRLRDASDRKQGQPEYRLPISIAGGVALPLSLVFYGWAADKVVPLALLLVSVAIVGAAVLATILPLAAYVVDAFNLYSASAMTSFIITRCFMAALLPVLVTSLSDILGTGWAFTVLAAAHALLAPIPILVMRFGEGWRAKGKYTKDVCEQSIE